LIVDVGGGASRLVDCLMESGYTNLTVVDVSEAALEVARRRLGDLSKDVTWLAADVRELRLPGLVDIWHDRAVFHFLTGEGDRTAYLASVRVALRVGGHVVISTFGPSGPQECSGLQVSRYSAEMLQDFFGPDFELVRSIEREHVTPWGGAQQFTYAVLRRLRAG
jgi:ubiquinone/menaquinone biosynthesis C-methylase UbiE